MSLYSSNPVFYWIAVAVVVVTASSRLTRVVTFDHFPPALWLRRRWLARHDSDWGLLAVCGYCFSFWGTALVVSLGDLAGVFDGKPVVDWFTPVWWLGFGTLGASYLAAMLMKRDGDDSEGAI